MYKGEKIIAIIPARSGSKQVVNKNIRKLAGKPLIAYTIEAAIKANIFDKILVSTDSAKYAKIARKCGASVPFLRSVETATDEAGSWDVVREVLSRLDETYSVVVLLQPTSPLRTEYDIREAVSFFFRKKAESLFTVCETAHPSWWCNSLDENQSAYNFIKKENRLPRQKLPKTYRINGAIYIVRTKALNKLNLYGKKSYVHVMEKKNSIDIDTNFDFLLAECLLKTRKRI